MQGNPPMILILLIILFPYQITSIASITRATSFNGYDQNRQGYIMLNNNNQTIGLITNKAFLIEKGTSTIKPYPSLNTIISSSTSAWFASLLDKSKIGLIMNNAIFKQINEGGDVISYSITGNIAMFNEYKTGLFIYIRRISSRHEVSLVSITAGIPTPPHTIYTMNDSFEPKCKYMPKSSQFICCFIDYYNNEILFKAILDEELRVVTPVEAISVDETIAYDITCNDEDCVVLRASRVDQITLQLFTFAPNVNGLLKNVFSIPALRGVSIERITIDNLLIILESSSVLHIQMYHNDFKTNGPVIKYYTVDRYDYNLKGVYEPLSSTFIQIILHVDSGVRKQLGLAFTFPLCKNIQKRIEINAIQTLSLGDVSQKIVFTAKPIDSSGEVLPITLDTVQYPSPVQVHYSQRVIYEYRFSTVESVNTLSSSGPELVDLFSTDCYLTLYVCDMSHEMNLLQTKCASERELIDEMNELMTDIDDKILQLKRPNASVGNSTYQIYNTTEKSINEAAVNGKNLSKIYFGDCEKILKDYYSIPVNDPLLIIKKDTYVEERFSNMVEFAVFTIDGKQLDLTHCDNINIMIPITNPEKYELMKNLSDMNVDLYDPTDPFFTDVCFSYTTNKGLDIPRKDRVKDYLQNSSDICPPQCDIREIDFATNMTNCSFSGKKPKPEPNTNPFEDIKQSLLSSITEGNWGVIFCYKRTFDIDIFLTNMGSWFMLVICFLLLVLMLIFFAKQFTKAEIYIYRVDMNKILEKRKAKVNLSKVNTKDKDNEFYSPQTEINKSLQNINNIEINGNYNTYRSGKTNRCSPSNYMNSICLTIDKQNQQTQMQTNPNQIDKVKSFKESKFKQGSQFIMNTPSKNNHKKIEFSGEDFSNYPQMIQISRVKSTKANMFNSNLRTNNSLTPNNQYYDTISPKVQYQETNQLQSTGNIIMETKTIEHQQEDYRKMSFEECCKNDNRHFFRHYWEYLKLLHPILSTFFCSISPTSLRTIIISLFFINIMIDFAMSAFFYSDAYISSNYLNEGLSQFWYNLPIALYSFIVGFALNIFLGLLSSSGGKIEEIIEGKENTTSVEMVKMKKILRCYKIKIAFFFISEFSFMGFCWYYTASFCAVYVNSQEEWLISGVISTCIGQGFPFITALVFTILLKICYACKCKTMFKLLGWIA